MNDIYRGISERLVLCLDIGTTCTGATMLHLKPGSVPVAKTVTTWPGGDQQSSKVPTTMLYHKGKPMAFGAECLEDEVRERASEDSECEEAKYFKLAVHPKSMTAPQREQPTASPNDPPPQYEQDWSGITRCLQHLSVTASLPKTITCLDDPRLPTGVSVEQVYADWLRWVCAAATEFFVNTSADGASLIERLGPSMHFILGCPNAWGLDEQQLLRTALFKAGLLSEFESKEVNGDDRLNFVSESEASVHFCLVHAQKLQKSDWMQVGTEFAVVDAGGSTVDTCVYTVSQVTPRLELREAKKSACAQAGAIYPTRFFRHELEQKLAKSKYGAAEYVDAIVSQFDSKTKCKHNGDGSNHVIRFGFERDADRSVNISKGRITLSSAEVSSAFQPCVDMIVASLKQQLEGQSVKHCLLVGGFGESPFLKQQLAAAFPNVVFVTADEPSRKAVSEGAALFHLNSTVVARAVRQDVGVSIWEPLAAVPVAQRLGRVAATHTPTGTLALFNRFTRIAQAGQLMSVHDVTTLTATGCSRYIPVNHPQIAVAPMVILMCDQDSSTKVYAGYCRDNDAKLLPGFREVCKVQADLRGLCVPANHIKNDAGESFWKVDFQVGLLLGGTHLKAVVIWEENGVEQRSPASVIPAGLKGV